MIEAEGLRKRCGDTRALDGLDLRAPAGSVLGVLGPNGAGKPTAVRILTTLARPDAGWARVAGLDVVADATEVKRRIGVTAQAATVDEVLTGRQNLVMIGRLSGLRRRDARARAADLLHRFDLTDAADRMARTYSGGMRRRPHLPPRPRRPHAPHLQRRDAPPARSRRQPRHAPAGAVPR